MNGARAGRGTLPAVALGLLVLGCGPDRTPAPERERATAPPLLDWARAAARDAEGLEPVLRRRLRVVTRVTFVERPDLPHRLVATWDDGRGRVELGLEADEGAPRAYEYLVDGRAFVRPAGATASTELEGPERDAVVRRFEARRAVWSSAPPEVGGPGRVPLPAGAWLVRDRDEADRERWTLRAEGTDALESWTVLDRDPDDGRPLRVLWGEPGSPIWTAERLDLDPDARFAERYFWPPDRWVDEPAPAPPPGDGR